MNPKYKIPPFALECREHAGKSWGASFHHPFVRSLADGSLDPKIFAFYQMQDARYLEAFSDACAILSTRVNDPTDKLWFLDAARMALIVEGQLHAGYGKKLGYTAKDIANLELTPSNRAYQNHMKSSAYQGSLVESLGAILPCPWLYIELGQKLLEELKEIPDSHPYADWLRMYSDEGFNEYMNEILSRFQRFADSCDSADRDRAKEAFLVSCRYEWMFWDQAWTRQAWPV